MKNTNQHLLDIREKYCPDWKPNWGDDSYKFYVTYGHASKGFYIDFTWYTETLGVIYFPSKEIARLALEHVESLYSEGLKAL